MAPNSPKTSDAARDDRNGTWRALIASGVYVEMSAMWCAAWEAEAARQHVGPDSRYFWDAGRSWIDAQRAIRDCPAP